jgi:aerotaxis receptor
MSEAPAAPAKPAHPYRSTAPALAEEVPFSFEELFFSRTDERGIILSGNSVFQRVSLYTWEELLDRPHNIIRHPDMPKGVFWLLWDFLKRREPIGAYVKNKARDGRYYWVFAIVTPITGGFLSVRLKPSSPLFATVIQEYATLVSREKQGAVPPAESAAFLLDRLKTLGFRDYPTFMATALNQEIAARDHTLRRAPNANLALLASLAQSAQGLLVQSAGVFAAYNRNTYLPLNLQVQAAQRGEPGAALGIISSNYSIISTEIKKGMSTFIAAAEAVNRTINDGLFLMGTASIQKEVSTLFAKEAGADSRVQNAEMQRLVQQQVSYDQKAINGLKIIAKNAELFHDAQTDMKRLSAGLEVVRIMGKVESSRLSVTKDGLNELIEDLGSFQQAIAEGLRDIDSISRAIDMNLQHMLETIEMQAVPPAA